MVLRSKKVLATYQTTGSVSTRQEKKPGDMTVVSLPLPFILLQSFLKGREVVRRRSWEVQIVQIN